MTSLTRLAHQSENPFTYGNPISEPDRFFGRQREIEQIFSRLLNVEFESSALVGERRVGKTSLLNYLSHPDVCRERGLAPEKYIFVYIDLQLLDKTTTSQQLWQWMLQKIGQHCRDAQIEKYIQELVEKKPIDNFALTDLFDSLNGKGKYIVLLLDEFENVTDNQNFGPDFFYGLRSLATHHNFSLVTSSCRELIELCHSEAIRSSPFFNIFANINLRLFSEEEARQLISGALAETEIGFTEQEIYTIFQIAGYHPFFLQAACHFLFEAYMKNLSPKQRVEFMLREFDEEATPHLRAYWYRSDEHEKILLTVLALLEDWGKVGGRAFSLKQLQHFYTRSPQTLAHLKKRSLLVSQANAYSLFNSSFGQWIRNEITDTRHEQDNYQDWLKSNQSLMKRLSGRARRELRQILPKIGSKYRDLIIAWVSDPKNLLTAAGLLKTALGL